MRSTDAHVIATMRARFGPVFHLREAGMLGVSSETMRRLAYQGLLTRYGKAAFIESAALSGPTSWRTFRLRASAFVLCSAGDAHLTGLAAAAIHQLPVIRPPSTLPTVLRSGSARKGPTTTEFGRTRFGFLPEMHQMTVGRFRVVSPAATVVDAARHFRRVDALVMADAARAGGVTVDEFGEIVGQMGNYPGIGSARWVIEHSDGRAESPLESVGRFVCLTSGLPTPLSNVWIGTAERRYRVDGLLPDHGIVLEGDGAVKYNNRPDAAQVVSEEKEREFFIRSLGYGMLRYTFEMAYRRPQELAGRIEHLIRTRRGTPVPTSWSLEDPRTARWYQRH